MTRERSQTNKGSRDDIEGVKKVHLTIQWLYRQTCAQHQLLGPQKLCPLLTDDCCSEAPYCSCYVFENRTLLRRGRSPGLNVL